MSLALATNCSEPLRPPAPTVLLVDEYPLTGHDANWITTDESGYFYVDDPFDRVIRRYGADGAVVGSYPTSNSCALPGYGTPSGIAYQAKRGLIFVAYDTANALRSFGGPYPVSCSGVTPLHRPLGLAVDPNDNVFVADYLNRRVMRFTHDLRSYTSFRAMPGATPSDLIAPEAVAIGPGGEIYVTDGGGGSPAASRVAVFRADGTFVRTFSHQGSGPGELLAPEGIAVDKKGRSFVADVGNKRIAMFNHAGNWMGSYGIEGDARGKFLYARTVAVASDGTLLVLDIRRRVVLRLRLVERLFDD